MGLAQRRDPAHRPRHSAVARRTIGWRSLGPRARAWRLVHAAWSVAQLGCLAYIWRSVATRRRDPRLYAGVSFVLAEGGALLVGRGNCPMARAQEQWGDPVPFFELILPRRAAKAAVPVLAAITGAALIGVVARKPGLVARA